MLTPNQPYLPIQPVNKPILCNPYEEPTEHWVYDRATGEPPACRRVVLPAIGIKHSARGAPRESCLPRRTRDDLPLVNALREDVKRWRQANYESATPVTKQLLAYWTRTDRARRLFFCQREAVETIIYLTEIWASDRRTRWNPKLDVDDYRRLLTGEKPSFVTHTRGNTFPILLILLMSLACHL